MVGFSQNIFVSYASEQRSIAEAVALALRGRGFDVFLDKDRLPAGGNYDQRLKRAVDSSDILVFLISPESVAEGSYALTELAFARQNWNSPYGRVLPVMVAHTHLDAVPAYLKAVTILYPQGNVAAEVAATVETIRGANPILTHVLLKAALIGLGSGMLSAFFYVRGSDPFVPLPSSALSLLPGVVFGIAVGTLVFLSAGRSLWRSGLASALIFATWVVVIGILLSAGATPKQPGPLDSLRLPFPSPNDLLQLRSDIEFKIIVAALVGSLGTWIAVALVAPGVRGVICIGLVFVAGLLPVFVSPQPSLLFMLWQTGVATALAYGLSSGPSRTAKSSGWRWTSFNWRTVPALVAAFLVVAVGGVGFYFLTAQQPSSRTLAAHGGYVSAIAFLPDGKRLVSAGQDQALKLWNLSDGELIRTFAAHTKPVVTLAIGKDGRTMLSGGQDYQILRWDLDKSEPIARFRGTDGFVTAVAVAPDGRYGMFGSYSGVLRYFSFATAGGATRTFASHGGPVRSVAFSPDGRRAISGGGRSLLLWDVAGDTPGDRGTLLGDRPLHQGNHHDGDEVLAVAYASDGSKVAAGTSKGIISYWEVETDRFKYRQAFTAHESKISGVVFFRDGKRLLTSGYDGMIRILDPETPKELAAFRGQASGITALALSADEKTAVSAGTDGSLMILNLPGP